MNRRGIALTLAVAAYLLSFFHRVAPAAIAQDLAAAFQISGAALGSLAATYFYIYTLMPEFLMRFIVWMQMRTV